MNRKRKYFSLVSMDGTLVAAGGFNGRAGTDVVEVFHPERNQWQEVSSLPSPKFSFAAVVVRRGDLTREAQERCRYQRRNELMEEQIRESLARLEVSLLSSLNIESSSDENLSDASSD